MNYFVIIQTTVLITLYVSKCLSVTQITDAKIRRLISQIFYIPPPGESYSSISNITSSASNDCLSGVCVPSQLFVNGTVLTSGADLLIPRMGLVDVIEATKSCAESEVCCKLIDDDNTKDQNFNKETDEFSEITSDDKDDDYNTIYDWVHECGIRNSKTLQPRISGDDKANENEFPWMVMVMKRSPKSTFYDYQCGGSLIHPSIVLTAAHCVSKVRPAFLHVRAGEWDLTNTDEILPHQDRNIQSVVVHRDFLKPTLLNDIAILTLKTPVELADNVNTICLPPQNHSFDKERNCIVTGWGKNERGRKGKYQTTLKKISLPIVFYDQCQKLFRKTVLGKYFRLDVSFICAGGELGIDTCDGDGGSPLVCKIPNTKNSYYQSGIVSWGIGCKQSNIPAAYVDVSRYRDWIDKFMNRMNFDRNFYMF